MNARVLILGVIVLIVGLVLTTVVADQTSTIGASVSIASFAGASALLDLVPLIYVAAIVLLAAQLMSSGAGFGGIAGVAKRFRRRRR